MGSSVGLNVVCGVGSGVGLDVGCGVGPGVGSLEPRRFLSTLDFGGISGQTTAYSPASHLDRLWGIKKCKWVHFPRSQCP